MATTPIELENDANIMITTTTTMNLERSPLLLTTENMIWLPPITYINDNNGAALGLLHEASNGQAYNLLTTFDGFAALNSSNLMDTDHRTVPFTDTEADTERNGINPLTRSESNIDATENVFPLELEEGNNLIHVENEHVTPNYLIVPSNFVTFFASDSYSVMSDDHANFQLSDDINFFQDDNIDSALCTGIDSLATESMKTNVRIGQNEQSVGNPIYHHVAFNNEGLNEVMKIEGPIVQNEEFTGEMMYSAQTLLQQEQNPLAYCNLPEYFPEPTLLNSDANNMATSVNQCMPVHVYRNTCTSEIKNSYREACLSQSTQTEESQRKQRPKHLSVKRSEKNGNNYLQTKQGRKERISPTMSVNSFRLKVGPNLRTLVAVLEITGIKRVSNFVPYVVMRRFNPKNMFLTIGNSINSLMSMNDGILWNGIHTEPDWKQLRERIEELLDPMDCGEELDSNLESRIYYKCVGNTDQRKRNYISISKELEDNGQPTYAPDVIALVGSAHLNVELSLQDVAAKCSNTEFNNVGTMVMRLKNPECTGILHQNGVLHVVGTQTFNQFRMSTRKFARMVQKTGANVHLTSLKVHFYVGMAKLPFPIDVEAMMKHDILSKYIEFDRTVFPGIAIKMNRSPLLCVVFATGAVLLTEAMNEQAMKTAFDKIYPVLRLFAAMC